MIKYFPVQSTWELDQLDPDEMVAGYMAGFRGEPEPGGDRSKAYWHGWRNGASDKGFRPIDSAQRILAARIVGNSRPAQAAGGE